MGETVYITCLSFKMVRWGFEEGILPDDVRSSFKPQSKENSVIIQNVTFQHAGKYKCHGLDDDKKLFEDHAFIKVVGKYSVVSIT